MQGKESSYIKTGGRVEAEISQVLEANSGTFAIELLRATTQGRKDFLSSSVIQQSCLIAAGAGRGRALHIEMAPT